MADMEAPASNQTVPVYIFMLLKESGNITLLILNINRLSCYKYKVFLYKSKGKLKEYLLSSDKGFVRMFGSETIRKKHVCFCMKPHVLSVKRTAAFLKSTRAF